MENNLGTDIIGYSNHTPEGVVFHGPKSAYDPDPRGVGAFLFDKLEEHKEKICQICAVTGQTETFSSVKLRSTRVALEMRKLRIKPGDTVMICSFNNLDTLVVLLATQYLGAVTTSLDPSFSVWDMTHVLRLTKPKFIFLGTESVNNIKLALEETEVKTDLVVFGEAGDCFKFSDFLRPSNEEEDFKPVVVNDKETAFIMFTSGTTGLPKGLMLSHYGILCGTFNFLAMGIDYECMMYFATLYWISAVCFTIMGVAKGGKKLVCPKFNPSTTFGYVEKYKVSFTFLTGMYMCKLQEENVCPYDTTSLKVCFLGGSPIVHHMLVKFRKMLPHTKVSVAYGLTEIGGVLSGYHTNNDFSILVKKPGNVGYPAPGVTMRIVDPDTEEQLGYNQTGEIRVKIPSIFMGYCNAGVKDDFDSKGWFKTGDIGNFDEDNFLYVVDRTKEIFKFQDWKIAPAPIEAVIMEHPRVAEAAVFGIPNVLDINHPMALVVLKKGHPHVTPEALIKFVDDRVLDKYRLRGGLKIVSIIPKTPTGKLQRRKLKDLVLKGEI